MKNRSSYWPWLSDNSICAVLAITHLPVPFQLVSMYQNQSEDPLNIVQKS